MVARQEKTKVQQHGALQGGEDRSLSHLVLAVVADVKAVSGAWVDLVTSETKVAARAAVTIVAMTVGAGIVVVSAWLFLVSAGVAFAASLGAPLALALLVATVLHIGAAVILGLLVLRLSRRLSFPVTRAALERSSGHEQPAHSKA